MSNYGAELIIDLHECQTPLTRDSITKFMKEVCTFIGMKKGPLFFWDYDTEEERALAPDHLAGISAVQFIWTSNITIHTLDRLNAVYLNIFTCGKMKRQPTIRFCVRYWKGELVQSKFVARK